MAVFVEGLPYILLACIVICNNYYVKDTVRLMLLQTETIDTLLKFWTFRGVDITDKVNLVTHFCKSMVNQKRTANQAYDFGLGMVRKLFNEKTISLSHKNNNNNNNNNIVP